MKYVSPTHGRIRMVTITSASLQDTCAVYERDLGYRVVERGTVGEQQATSWGAPLQTGWETVLLAPASGAEIYLRLVAVPRIAAGYSKLRHWGWAAVEVVVADVDAVFERFTAGDRRSAGNDHAGSSGLRFSVFGAPQALELSEDFRPMQAAGPAGEMVFLTETHGDSAHFDLPRARCAVDHPFIAVLASHDLDSTCAFYRAALGLDQGLRFSMAYTTINKTYELDPDDHHEVALLQAGREVVIEADRYPDSATERPRVSGYLPPGIAMVSLLVDRDRLGAHSNNAWHPTTDRGLGYRLADGTLGHSTTVTGPSGELVELIQLGTSSQPQGRNA